MSHRVLHDGLAAYVEQAAWQLAADVSAGADVPFELAEEPGGRSPLYRYRPLTDDFIRSRIGDLGRLPAYDPAARTLGGLGGLEAYLQMRGETRIPAELADRVDAVMRAFVQHVFTDCTEFTFDAERFERAYAELEACLVQSRSLAQVIAPIRGLALSSPEIVLGEGLSLVRVEDLPDAPPEVRALARRDGGSSAAALAVLTVEHVPGEPPPLTAARLRFRRLLSALRLYDAGAFLLGPAAWARIDSGPWQLASLGTGGRPRGGTCLVEPAGEDELRAFWTLLERRPARGGEVAWALARFEMGCERIAPFEALTDHLLALRALLEPEGPGSGRLATRLAAICASAADRAALAERVAHAISLERAAIGGLAPAQPGADAIVGELAEHLRALLRDVVCGHLDADLCAVADGVLDQPITVSRGTPVAGALVAD